MGVRGRIGGGSSKHQGPSSKSSGAQVRFWGKTEGGRWFNDGMPVTRDRHFIVRPAGSSRDSELAQSSLFGVPASAGGASVKFAVRFCGCAHAMRKTEMQRKFPVGAADSLSMSCPAGRTAQAIPCVSNLRPTGLAWKA